MCYQYVCIVQGLFYITAGVVLRSDIWRNCRQRSVFWFYKLPQVGAYAFQFDVLQLILGSYLLCLKEGDGNVFFRPADAHHI